MDVSTARSRATIQCTVYLDEPLVLYVRGDDALGVDALVEADVRLVRAGRPGSRRSTVDDGYGSGRLVKGVELR